MKFRKSIFPTFILVFMSVVMTECSNDTTSTAKSFNRVLLFQWNTNASLAGRSEMIKLFKGLPEKIEGLNSFEISDIENSSDSFESILVLKFVSEDVVKNYESHEDHLRIAALGPELVSKFAVVDYWE